VFHELSPLGTFTLRKQHLAPTCSSVDPDQASRVTSALPNIHILIYIELSPHPDRRLRRTKIGKRKVLPFPIVARPVRDETMTEHASLCAVMFAAADLLRANGARVSPRGNRQVLFATLTGMSADDFEAEVKKWLTRAKDGRSKRPYTRPHLPTNARGHAISSQQWFQDLHCDRRPGGAW
jgi:hypothetical protein